jgi:hypothetical protein
MITAAEYLDGNGNFSFKNVTFLVMFDRIV